MTAYLISYDLRNDRDYTALIQKLREWRCVSPLKSVWLGNFTGSAGQVRDAIATLVDGDDGVLVVELTPGSDWATLRVRESADGWLQRNVTP